MYPFLVLVPLAVSVAFATYIVRTSPRDGTGVPWIGTLVVGLLSSNIFGGVIAVAVRKGDHEDKVVRRKIQRDAFALSRVQPYRSTSVTPTGLPLIPVSASL